MLMIPCGVPGTCPWIPAVAGGLSATTQLASKSEQHSMLISRLDKRPSHPKLIQDQQQNMLPSNIELGGQGAGGRPGCAGGRAGGRREGYRGEGRGLEGREQGINIEHGGAGSVSRSVVLLRRYRWILAVSGGGAGRRRPSAMLSNQNNNIDLGGEGARRTGGRAGGRASWVGGQADGWVGGWEGDRQAGERADTQACVRSKHPVRKIARAQPARGWFVL